MNFRKLLTYLAVGTAAVIPFAGAQNPTILQGNYISNVFGNSNFVLNPNAQTNVANVTNATRSTTTPLVATSEFTLALASGANATWTLRAFDAGMKGQNCEARFSYRGFATATTKAEIVQNSLVVAHLVLTPSTDPRIASINFPCGDLANATTFRIAQTTATMTGTNEIGGIYVGLATNMANVAQAENILNARRTTTQSIPSSSETTVIYATEELDAYGEYDSTTGVFTAKRAGQYQVIAQTLLTTSAGWAATEVHDLKIRKNSSAFVSNRVEIEVNPTGSPYLWNSVAGTIDLAVGDTLDIRMFQNNGAAINIEAGGQYNRLSIARFPSSSELVVTPERQNTFGGVKYINSNQTIRAAAAPSSSYQEFNNATWNQPTLLIGKAQVTTTGSGNDLGFSIPNLPVGQWKLSIRGLISADTNNATTAAQSVNCSFKIRETTLASDVALQVVRDVVLSSLPSSTRDYTSSFFGVFNNTSVATRNFRLEAAKVNDSTTGSVGACQAYSNTAAERTEIVFLIEPLDQPSNSALYVQGPVLGAQTGAAIPEGYVNEFATRSITDTSLRQQSTPTVGTFYYPWTSTLTLPSGNWLLCYKAIIEHEQTAASGTVAYPRMHIQNQTDSTDVMTQAVIGQLTSAPFNIAYIWGALSQCKPIAITSSKTFRMGIAYTNNTGLSSVIAVRIRGDVSQTELYAVRLN